MPNERKIIQTVLPDCCFDFIFRFEGENLKSSFLCGPMMKPIIISVNEKVEDSKDIIKTYSDEWFFGIRFNPGYAKAILGIDGIGFQDICINFETLTKSTSHASLLHRLEFEIGNAKSYKNCTSVALKILNEIFPLILSKKDSVDKFSLAAISKIKNSKIGITLNDLEKYTGFSKRQIERKFSKYVGYTPKQFTQVSRFHSCVSDINQIILRLKVVTASDANVLSKINWAEIAIENGYVDQSHFNHEFKKFSGTTPLKHFSK